MSCTACFVPNSHHYQPTHLGRQFMAPVGGSCGWCWLKIFKKFFWSKLAEKPKKQHVFFSLLLFACTHFIFLISLYIFWRPAGQPTAVYKMTRKNWIFLGTFMGLLIFVSVICIVVFGSGDTGNNHILYLLPSSVSICQKDLENGNRLTL